VETSTDYFHVFSLRFSAKGVHSNLFKGKRMKTSFGEQKLLVPPLVATFSGIL
jgi:hypothetical protein